MQEKFTEMYGQTGVISAQKRKTPEEVAKAREDEENRSKEEQGTSRGKKSFI